ncbi:bHLH domain containing transcription factor AP-4 [Oopsacas minuta]|uniref:BHLH domain containing transcription factor AP-4 n=1 Tax=Oopsacas minuta TaxID=111878 RepID=A0AAV7K7X3_9METZ|nr:bHLH domain containing transcription factor AP-4 [Oopsacas minuta]
MDMMRIEPTMVSTPPIPHQHHPFHSPHSAFSSMSSNNITQRGMSRSMSSTPNSMMGPPLHRQDIMRQSPVAFHNMQTLNRASPHPQTTPIPEIHPASYPPPEHHFALSPTLSCPIRESPHNLAHNGTIKITQQEMPPPHTLCYSQPRIYDPFKSQQISTHPQTCKVPSNFRPNTPAEHLTDSSNSSNMYPQQVSTPITYAHAVNLPQQYSVPINNITESTSSQPSLESIEFESELETARTSIDESTANLVISTRDDLRVSPTTIPFSVVVTSIATSSHDNMSDTSNFPGSPTCLSSPNSSKFPHLKERKAMDKKMRREIANCNERKRMENINSGFRSLKVLLPQTQNEKTSKAAILQQTAKYIHRLVEEKRRLIEENDKVKHELSKYIANSQYGGVIGKNTGFVQPAPAFQTFNSSPQISKPETDYYSRLQDEVTKLQEQLKHERNSKCMLEKINRELESRVGFMESVHTYNPDPVLSSRDTHCKHNLDAIAMSLEQLEGECYTNLPPSPPSAYERQTPYVEILDRSTTPYAIDRNRNTPVGHFRAIKSPMPHH